MSSNQSINVVPRRSVLYMPASNERAMQKAAGLPVDAVVLDLEDAVSPLQKDQARVLMLQVASEIDWGYRELVVRVNGLDTPWFEEDLKAAVALPISAIALPKVESAGDVQALERALDKLSVSAPIALWPMIETPRGVQRVADVVSGSTSVNCLVMGTSDLAKELQLRNDPQRTGLQFALSQCVLASRAEGIDILDGVCLDLKDQQLFDSHCHQGVALGFTGKTLIHPSQIETCNRVFGVDAQELQKASAIVNAWRDAEAEGSGVVVVDGALVESLHVDNARRLIQLAALIEQRSE